MNGNVKKRVTVKPKHPNPLFEQWLIEWRDKAIETNSKMQYCFSQALTSLKKYPLPLESGRDCKILKGFGEKLCKMLDEKLEHHKAQSESAFNKCEENVPVQKVTNPLKRKAEDRSLVKIKSQEYIPKFGSGAYAILVTLVEKSLQPGYPGYLLKSEIVQYAQHLCDVSFTKSGPDNNYTAWSSMKTLLGKKLVQKHGIPAKFSLTAEGTALADTLYVQQKIEEFKKMEKNKEVVSSETKIKEHNIDKMSSCSYKPMINSLKRPKINSDPIWHQASSSSNYSGKSSPETVIFAPNSFQIILLVDTQELNGSKSEIEHDPIIRALKSWNVRHEVRNLKVGDYAWICRDNNSDNELILPYIIERKRMDDFGKSIKDDRFHEQKFRLKQSGIQNLIYLIESYGKNEHVGLPITTLYQAAVNTLVHDGFSVKFTENGNASCEYLASLTKFLVKLFKGKTLVSCLKEDLEPVDLNNDLIQLMHFQEFNKTSSKSKHFKVKEMFIRQLLQISGMSVEKVLAIVEKYPTPKVLKLHYNETGDVSECEKVLANVQYGLLRKKVGPVLSKIVYQLFSANSY